MIKAEQISTFLNTFLSKDYDIVASTSGKDITVRIDTELPLSILTTISKEIDRELYIDKNFKTSYIDRLYIKKV